MITERFQVRDIVVLLRQPDSFQPGLARLSINIDLRQNRHENVDRSIHGAANRSRGTIHLLDGRRQLLKQQHGTFRREQAIRTCNLPDFGNRFFDALDCWL